MILYNELAENYFAIENHHRDIQDDISFIRSMVNRIHHPRLLDIGCGSGEHLSFLSRYGINCVGIDSSEAMINTARKRFPHKIEFIHDNIRTFDYYQEFDIIISLFGSFNYMIEDSDIERALWNIWRAMKNDGVCILETWNSLPITQIRQKKIDHISTTTQANKKIERYRGFRLLNDRPRTIVEVNYKYLITEQNSKREITDKHHMRCFTRDEFTALLEENGFRIRELFANSLKEPFTGRSNRMFIVFEKADI